MSGAARHSRFQAAGIALAVSLLVPVCAENPNGPRKTLTLETASGTPPLVPRGISNTAWRDAQRLTFLKTEGRGPDARASLYELDMKSGKTALLLEPPPIPGQERTIPLTGASWNSTGTRLLLSGHNDLWIWDTASRTVVQLTKTPEEEEEFPTFSPDGANVAFSKKNDLFIVETATGRETKLTSTGDEHVLNGKLDWVYEEELARRDDGQAFTWAPDSRSLAYLRLDERRVPVFPLVDFSPPNGKTIQQKYPKAGDPNAIPSVHAVDLTGREMAVFNPVPDDVLIGPELTFTPDSKSITFTVMNRDQTALSVHVLSCETRETAVLLTEKDPAWINSHRPPVFFSDGSGFLWLSEQSGFLHLYRYGKDAKQRNAVTKGNWFVDSDFEIDEKNGVVFFIGTEKDARERHVYRAKLDGSSLTRLSMERGTHSLTLAPGGHHYLDTYSNLETPPRSAVFDATGILAAVAFEPKHDLASYGLAKLELGSFTGSAGTLFFTKLVKPPDFDATKKYPVIVHVYGGPHYQMVQDRWGGTSLFDHFLASRGYLVWSVDNRGSWGRGHAFEAAVKGRLGELELKDQLEGLAHLKKLPFVDGNRIGITGWSYGGYMALIAATRSSAFKCAVAGAPVTDWKLYDSIYTERYMNLPSANREGYEKAAPVTTAETLGAKLLILHGTEDDNVHMQQSMVFVEALIKARKDFVFVPLPGQKHGPRDPAVRTYVNQRIFEFFKANL